MNRVPSFDCHNRHFTLGTPYTCGLSRTGHHWPIVYACEAKETFQSSVGESRV